MLANSIYSSSWRSYGTLYGSGQKSQDKAKKDAKKAKKDGGELPVDKRKRVLSAINLGLMCIVLICYGMCASVFAPFFPTEAAKKGISATTVGFIFGTFTFVMFIGSPISGLLVDELGLNFMIGAGTLLAGGTTILFGALDYAPPDTIYIVLCFAVRIVEGAGAILYNTAAFSSVTLLYPESVSTVYAVLETASGVGRMIGPSVGGILYNVGGFPLPFYVIGGVLLVVGFLSMLLQQVTLPSPPKKGNEKKSGPSLGWLHLYRVSIEIWILTISMSASSLIFGYPTPTLALYLEELGLTDPATVGLVFLGGSLSYTVLSVFIGKMADTFPGYVYQMMTLGAALFALAFFLMGPIPPIHAVIPPSIGLTIGSYIILTAGVAILLNPAPAAIMLAARSAGYKEGLETSGMVAGLYNTMWFMGSFSGSPVAGVLMDNVGFEWGSFIMSMSAVAIVFMYLSIPLCVHRVDGLKARRQYDYAIFNNETESSVLLKIPEENETEDES